MKWTFLILSLFVLPACGGFTLFKNAGLNDRKVASIESSFENQDFQAELRTLHHYHLLAQKKISVMDHKKILVIKSKIEEIETGLLKKNSSNLKKAVHEFASKSKLTNLSMKKLGHKLGMKLPVSQEKASLKEIEDAIREAKGTREFQVIDMNVEHLSHMMTVKLKTRPHQKTTKINESLDCRAQHPDKITVCSKI